MQENTASPAVMSGITAALSQMLCVPSFQREICAALMNRVLDPAIKLLDRDIQWHFRQETQDQ